MRGDRTSGLGNLTRKGTRLRTFWSVDSASTKSRCFWEGPEGKGWKSEERSKLVHLLSARASTCSQDPLSKNSLHALERPWRSQILSTCLLSQELLPACEIIPSRVFVSPRLARVIPVAFLRHSQRQFSTSLLTSYLPSLFQLFSRPRSIEDYVEQQPKSPMPRCQKPFRWSPGGEKPGPK